MAIQGPPPPKKKSGLGCCGCGCLILVIILVLVFALFGFGGYRVYQSVLGVTTATPSDIPAPNVSDDAFSSGAKKIAAFNQDLANHTTSTLTLSVDEVNSLIAHNPDLTRLQAKTNISMTDHDARVQATLPSSAFSLGLMTGRYLNIDTTFTLGFDADTHQIMLLPKTLQIGNMALIGPNADNGPNASISHAFSQGGMQPLNDSLNKGLRKNPAVANFLDQVKSMEIKDGQLVIESQ